MSANKYQPHLVIIPEDDAYRQMAVGFIRYFPDIVQRKTAIRNAAGGWARALEAIAEERLDAYEGRLLVVLIDFDQSIEIRNRKIEEALAKEPASRDRIFVIGAFPEAQNLARELDISLAKCGQSCAAECVKHQNTFLDRLAFKHNATTFGKLAAAFHQKILGEA